MVEYAGVLTHLVGFSVGKSVPIIGRYGTESLWHEKKWLAPPNWARPDAFWAPYAFYGVWY